MLHSIKAAIKALAILLWIALMYPPIWLAYKLKRFTWRDRMASFGHRGLLRIIGLQVNITGLPSALRPQLLVTNHISYLDIIILCAHTKVHFTPKSEIAGWPLIGHATRTSGALFIDRRPEKVVEMKQSIHAALSAGDVLCLFPEATTGNGLHIKPFKSGFFSLAEEFTDETRLVIQPAAITYTHIRSLPIDSTQWPHIAWYGDMDLVPHLWQLLKMAPLTAELVFLPPVDDSMQGGRKALAAHCQKVINDTIQDIRSRRHVAPTKRPSFHPKFLRIKH